MKRFAIFIFVLALSISLFAENFYIDGYDINIKVDEAGKAHITEDMNVVFTAPSHGIYRDIEYIFSNPNNIWSTIFAKVDNIKSNMPLSISKENGFVSLRLGDSSKYLDGKQRILISYDYDLGGDIYPDDYDEFYYNLISAAWDCPIRDISYSVSFPKPLEKNRIWVTFGDYGSDRNAQFSLSPDMLTINGKLNVLESYQALTLRVEMDNGYFSRQAKDVGKIANIVLPISILVPILFALYAILSYRRYGIDKPLTPPVTFHPPKDFNPMDVSYVYNGNSLGDDEVTAMFFYWADKGYLKIEERDKNSFTFIKQKDVPADESKAERNLFALLFKQGDTVTFKDLESEEFGLKATKVFPLVKAQFTASESLKDPKSEKKKKINIALLLLFAIISGAVCSLASPGLLTLVLAIINLIGVSIIYLSVANIISKFYLRSKFKSAMLSLLCLIVLFMFVLANFVVNLSLTYNVVALIQPIVAALSFLISSIAVASTEKRSEYGERTLEECIGYKDFIERVEIDKLKLLIQDDPDIFYRTLSYAIVFGLEDTWANKFKNLYIQKCSWYYSPTDSLMDAMFYSSLIRRSRHCYRQMQREIIKTNSPRSGGGGSHSFSGFSGFSGGGFSGGGGRSW